MKPPRGLDWRQLDRRRFIQMVGGASSLRIIGGPSSWTATPTRKARFAYVGTEQAIHVYSIVYSITANERLIERQTIASAHPVAMAISNGNLYVANHVSEYGSLPRGSVEAYAIDAATGQLKLLNRVPLSLSGIQPRDLAVAPDGRSIVVAVHGGGAYNVLSVHAGGRLGPVSSILKETGSGPHSLQAWAHPSAVVFDRAGRVLAADQGSDKLSVLSLANGELDVTARYEVNPGSGPTSMALDPAGTRLYVAHSLNGSVSSFGYDAAAGRILDHKQTVPASGAGEMAVLVMHPSGDMLYSSHGDVQVWKIALDGALGAVSGVEGVRAHKLYVTADGGSLLALSRDGVLRMKIDSVTRALAAPVKLAALSNTASIAIL